MDACNRKTCPLSVLVLMNLLVFMAGGAVLIAGFMYKFSSGFLEVQVTSMFNTILINTIPLGVLADAVAYIMIIVGGLVVFMAIFGMIGGWKGIRGCLWAFITMAILMILLQGAVIGLWVFLRQTSDDWLRGKMIKLLVDYEGPTATDTTSQGWNTLFMKAECCGIDNQYWNGGTNNDFSSVPANWWAARGGDNIPASCCQGASSDTVSTYVASTLCTTPDPPINFYTTGCFNRIKDIVNTYSLICLIALGVVFFVQVTAIVCACILVKSNKVGNRSKQTEFDNSVKDRRKVEYDTVRKWKNAFHDERNIPGQPRTIRPKQTNYDRSVKEKRDLEYDTLRKWKNAFHDERNIPGQAN